MKTQEKVEIVRYEFIQPEKLKTIFLVVLGSFAIGSIPILCSINTSTPTNTIPTEATLWEVMGERTSN